MSVAINFTSLVSPSMCFFFIFNLFLLVVGGCFSCNFNLHVVFVGGLATLFLNACLKVIIVIIPKVNFRLIFISGFF